MVFPRAVPPLPYVFRPSPPRLPLPHPLRVAPRRTSWFGLLATPSAVALDRPGFLCVANNRDMYSTEVR